MSRRVTHDGKGTLEVRFPFDRTLVDRVKSLPHRRWNAGEKFWSVPDLDVVALVDLLRSEGFRFDRATRGLYRDLGGTATLEERPDDGPLLPGLFDDPRPAAETAVGGGKAAAGETPDYTVSRLNDRVRQAIAEAFPGTVWLVGEISGFNKSAHRRHVGFELVERTEAGETVSKVSATLFESTRREIESALARAGDPFRLEDEVSVRLRVRVDLYAPWGQYRAVVEELDPRYTLGEAARRREEILRRLAEQKLIGKNAALELPRLPLRVGLVTSIGSDACNDVLRTLQEARFAFRVTVHGARVQGRATEPSVLNALDWFRARADRFDVLLVCRGGGSRTDLSGFDSERLGRAVAEFPLPVVVGIGHEQDQSVLDAVGRSCKTPTAAAALLVETVRESLDRCEALGDTILGGAAQLIEEQQARGRERARRLALAARHRLQEERSRLAHHRSRVVSGSKTLLVGAAQRIAGSSRLVPQLAWRALERSGLALEGAGRALVRGARRDLEAARLQLTRAHEALPPRCRRLLAHEGERLQARRQRLRLADPRRVLKRGYSVLRLAGGELLTRADRAPRGTMVRALLKDGTLRLRSEGKEGD
jgi:exodeoxyribonuclease VII large subunit